LNSENQRLLERVQLGGEAFLSGTTIRGTFWLRACIVNPRATAADVERLPRLVLAAAAK
jgi:hypothetical protein